MTTVAIRASLANDLKNYLVDIDDYTLGELIEDCVYFALVEHLKEFEVYAGVYDDEESDSVETDQKDGE